MDNFTDYIAGIADAVCTFYDRVTGRDLCDAYIMGGTAFPFDDEGIIADQNGYVMFSIGEGLYSWDTLCNAARIMGVEPQFIGIRA